jgi:hypothetical protein
VAVCPMVARGPRRLNDTTVQAASGQGAGRPQWRWRPMGRAELNDLDDGYSQYSADQSRA